MKLVDDFRMNLKAEALEQGKRRKLFHIAVAILCISLLFAGYQFGQLEQHYAEQDRINQELRGAL